MVLLKGKKKRGILLREKKKRTSVLERESLKHRAQTDGNRELQKGCKKETLSPVMKPKTGYIYL